MPTLFSQQAYRLRVSRSTDKPSHSNCSNIVVQIDRLPVISVIRSRPTEIPIRFKDLITSLIKVQT